MYSLEIIPSEGSFFSCSSSEKHRLVLRLYISVVILSLIMYLLCQSGGDLYSSGNAFSSCLNEV